MSKNNFTVYLQLTFIAYCAMLCSVSAQTNTNHTASITQTQGIESIEIKVSYTPIECDYYKLQCQFSGYKEWEDIAILLATDATEVQTYTYNEERTLTQGNAQYRLSAVIKEELKVLSPITEIEIEQKTKPKTEVHKFIYTDVETENVNLRLVINQPSDIEGGFYNSKGNLIQKVSKSKVRQGLNEFSFDISSIDAGQYLLILKVGGENIVEKITI